MKQLIRICLSVIVIVFAARCDNLETDEKEVANVTTSNEVEAEEVENNGVDESDLETVETIDDVIADDDYIKATLVSIEHVIDDLFDEDSYVLKIEIENKTAEKIIVQSRDVSIDGVMVDEMVVFSPEVAGDKKANSKMEILSFEEDLPEMKDNIEFKLIVIEDESFETVSETDVSITF